MAVKEIPVVPQSAPYTFKIVLDGITINMKFRWNWRMQKWIMDLFDSNNVLLVAGIPIVLGVDLLQQYKGDAENIPQGVLFAQDTSGKGQEANFENFGVTVLLSYDNEVE